MYGKVMTISWCQWPVTLAYFQWAAYAAFSLFHWILHRTSYIPPVLHAFFNVFTFMEKDPPKLIVGVYYAQPPQSRCIFKKTCVHFSQENYGPEMNVK